MEDAIKLWFNTGKVGVSSKAIANAVLDKPQEEPWATYGNYPSDTADLNRCIALLHQVPAAREHLGKVAKVSKVWARFIKHWAALEAMFLDEAGLNFSKHREAPKSHAFMKAIIKNTPEKFPG